MVIDCTIYNGVHVAVIAGESHGASVSITFTKINYSCLQDQLDPWAPPSLMERGAWRTIIYLMFFMDLLLAHYSLLCVFKHHATMYLDFKLDPGATMSQPVTEG